MHPGLAWALGLVLVLIVPAAAPQEDVVELTVRGHDGDGAYWFEVDGLDGRNPTLELPRDASVVVTFVNEGEEPHDFHVASPIDEQTRLLASGETERLPFRVPADAPGRFQYWCDPHRDMGMLGEVRTVPADEDAPGLAVPFLLGALLVLAGARRSRR